MVRDSPHPQDPRVGFPAVPATTMITAPAAAVPGDAVALRIAADVAAVRIVADAVVPIENRNFKSSLLSVYIHYYSIKYSF